MTKTKPPTKDSLPTELQPVPPTQSANSLTPLFKFTLILFPILAGIATFLFLRLLYLQKTAKIASLPALVVVSTSPSGNIRSTTPKIVINFNLPVTAHHAESYIYVSPITSGKFTQGDNPKQIIFSPTSPYKPGTYINVTLKAGLPSESGKRLLFDHVFNFNVDFDVASIHFVNGNWDGKFMSFPQDKGTDITVKVGAEIKSPKIKIFRANPDTLLQSLVYRSNTDNKSNTPYYGEAYLELPVDTDKLKLVEEKSDIADGYQINFTNPTGIYLLEGLDSDDNVLAKTWIALNETAIHMRQDDKSVYLAAQNLATGDPESDIDVSFYTLGDKPQITGKHTLSGIQQYPLEFPQRLDLILAQKGKDTMIIPVSLPNSQAEIRTYRDLSKTITGIIYTDRPIYKPGDKIYFRGIIRTDNDGIYGLPQPKKIKVSSPSYSDPKVKNSLDQIVDVKDNGTFAGELVIPKDAAPSQYNYLFATTDILTQQNYSGVSTNFEVSKYIKPPYELSVSIEKPEYTKGDKVVATISGKFFNGKPMTGETVDYALYKRDYYETEKAVYNSSFRLNNWGGMCGGGSFGDEYYGVQIYFGKPLGPSITLDKDGKARVEINTADLVDEVSQEVTLVAQKLDPNQNKIVSAKGAIVHQGEYNIFLKPGPTQGSSGDTFPVQFYAESSGGSKISQGFTYEVTSQAYSSNNTPQKTIIKNGTTTTDGSGNGTISFSIDSANPQYYLLTISGKDSKGNVISASRNIYIQSQAPDRQISPGRDSNQQVVLKISSATNNLTPGQDATLEINSPQDLKVFTTFERGRVYNPQWLDLKKGPNTFTFSVPDSYMPSITPTFSFITNGEYHIEGLALNVPAMKKLITVETSTDKPQYNPGDTALVTILTKDANGNFISSDVGIAIVDKAIFTLRKSFTPPLHSSFYFFRARSTNSSSSLHWIANMFFGGGGGGGGGGELLGKDVDTLYWNPDLKTGSDGRITVSVPVGSSETTWKIVSYASTTDTQLGQAENEFLVAK